MTISHRSIALTAALPRLRALRWMILAATATATLAVPGVADAAPRMGAYDGSWTVLIITQAGACDQTYSFPVQIAGGRVSSGGFADVTGSVGRGGGVVVRVSAGGSYATGSGRLGLGSGVGRWSGKASAGTCSGRWQATRS
jgi:hypothetical protein